MNPKILLEKIIEKAVKNGWKSPFPYVPYTFGPSTNSEPYSIEGMFFDHSFAKTYFGEAEVNPESYGDLTYKRPGTVKRWEYHISKLALTPPEERLSYLGKFI